MARPRPAVFTALDLALTRPPVLLALDFDGTLAPLQNDPDASRIIPTSRAALDRIMTCINNGAQVALALISGRPLADLVRLADPPVGTYLAGSHGMETGRMTPGGIVAAAIPLSAGDEARRAEWLAWAEQFVAAHPGAHLEPKPDGLAVHVRTVADAARRLEWVHQVGQWGEQAGAHIRYGSNVVELTCTTIDKGHAITRLREETGARAVIYAGDDVTDEDAFAVLTAPDVPIKVGIGDTSARYRCPDEAALAQLLEHFADQVERGAAQV